MQGGGGINGHVLGAKRIRRAAQRVVECLAEQPLQVPAVPEGDEPAQGALAVARGGGQQDTRRGGLGATRCRCARAGWQRSSRIPARPGGSACGSACGSAGSGRRERRGWPSGHDRPPTAGTPLAGLPAARCPVTAAAHRATAASRSSRKIPSPRCSTAGTQSGTPRVRDTRRTGSRSPRSGAASRVKPSRARTSRSRVTSTTWSRRLS